MPLVLPLSRVKAVTNKAREQRNKIGYKSIKFTTAMMSYNYWRVQAGVRIRFHIQPPLLDILQIEWIQNTLRENRFFASFHDKHLFNSELSQMLRKPLIRRLPFHDYVTH